MAEIKTYQKRLTESGGTACVLTFIAFLLSVVGVLTEYIGVNIYNAYFITKKDHIFANSIDSFVSVYEKSIIITLLTFVLFIVLCTAKSKKKIGVEIPSIMFVLSIVLSAKPVIDIAQIVSTGEFSATMKYASDGDKFRSVLNLLIVILPVVSCFLLLVTSLVLFSRLVSEDFTVNVPMVKRVAIAPTPSPIINSTPKPTVEPKFEYGHSNYIEPDMADSYKKEDGAEPVNAPISDTKLEDDEKQQEDLSSEETNEISDTSSADEFSVICNVCNNPSPSGSKFCKKCGATLQEIQL